MYHKKSEIYIKELDRSARLYVGLPDDYETSGKRYPVLYMHDGHNVFSDEDSFSGVSWGLIEAYEKDKSLPDIIVVGLECANGLNRFNEYSPFEITHPSFAEYSKNTKAGGKGDIYLNYLSEVLKREIDAKYRTLSDKDYTAIMGSSMGGVISLYAGLKYNHIFSRIGAVSGSYFTALDSMLNAVETSDLTNINKLYMDVGTKEAGVGQDTDYIKANRKVYKVLSEKLDIKKLRFEVIEGGIHHESEWRKRLPDIIKYLFND